MTPVKTPGMAEPVRKAYFKVCLMGEARVGKTSLVRRYVHHAFEEKYLQTIGTVVSKHIDLLNLEGGGMVQVNLLIWDIMGQKGFRDLLSEAYFDGLRAGLAVFDVTRSDTLEGLPGWIDSARSKNRPVPILVLGNKSDLVDQRQVTNDEARDFCRALGLSYIPTSAKSGMNVEEAFRRVALEALRTYTPLEVSEESEGE
jgi:small GTP-binding protein